MSSPIDDSRDAAPARDIGLLGALAYEAYADGLRRYLAEHGHPDVRAVDTQLFRLLDARGGATVTEIARARGVSKQAASQHIAQFVARGYGEQRPSPGDARERIVTLTERARAARRTGIEYADRIAAQLTAELGAETVDAGRRVLERVIAMHLDEASEFVRAGARIGADRPPPRTDHAP